MCRSSRHILGEPTLRLLRRVRRVAGDLWRDPHLNYGYFRRATRPNELFLVADPRGRGDLEAATRALMAR